MVFFADVSVVEYSCCRENSNCAECHSSPALSDLNESPGDSRITSRCELRTSAQNEAAQVGEEEGLAPRFRRRR